MFNDKVFVSVRMKETDQAQLSPVDPLSQSQQYLSLEGTGAGESNKNFLTGSFS